MRAHGPWPGGRGLAAFEQFQPTWSWWRQSTETCAFTSPEVSDFCSGDTCETACLCVFLRCKIKEQVNMAGQHSIILFIFYRTSFGELLAQYAGLIVHEHVFPPSLPPAPQTPPDHWRRRRIGIRKRKKDTDMDHPLSISFIPTHPTHIRPPSVPPPVKPLPRKADAATDRDSDFPLPC